MNIRAQSYQLFKLVPQMIVIMSVNHHVNAVTMLVNHRYNVIIESL